MAGIDRVCRIGRVIPSKSVVEFSYHLSTGGNINDDLRNRLLIRVYTPVANEIIRCNVGNGLCNVSDK